MSEITTGAVPLAIIGAPLAVGAACISAAYYAGKFCADQYNNMLDEIEATNKNLQWLDKQMVSSPKQMMEEAKRLQNMVSQSNAFHTMTKGMQVEQKNILSGMIATQHSPLKSYIPSILEKMPVGEGVFQKALEGGTKQVAKYNFNFVATVVKGAAKATGFAKETKVLKSNDSMLDIVFGDSENRRFTAYCKMDNDLNPTLALDLEGFACDDKACSLKMDDIVNYLQKNGVPFEYKRLKHNQPQGVLRKLLNKKQKEEDKKILTEYLQSPQQTSTNSTKHK